MRIAVISDLHANWAALRALPGTYDAILCTGDLVDYGAEPEPIMRFVREHVFAVVQGNYDYAAGTHEDRHCSPRRLQTRTATSGQAGPNAPAFTSRPRQLPSPRVTH